MYFNIANASSSVHHWKLLAGVEEGGEEKWKIKKRREPEIMSDTGDWQLSDIFSANTVFCNTLDGDLLLLGNSSCVKSTRGLEKKKKKGERKKEKQHASFPCKLLQRKMVNIKKQNLLCIFSLLIRSVFLIDLGVASASVSLSHGRLRC